MKITYKLVRQELQIPFTVPSYPCLSPSHTLLSFPSLPWTGPALRGPPRPLTQTQPHRPPAHSLSFKDKTPATHSLSSYSINFSLYPWVLLFSKQMFFHLKQIPFLGANKCSFILKQTNTLSWTSLFPRTTKSFFSVLLYQISLKELSIISVSNSSYSLLNPFQSGICPTFAESPPQ